MNSSPWNPSSAPFEISWCHFQGSAPRWMKALDPNPRSLLRPRSMPKRPGPPWSTSLPSARCRGVGRPEFVGWHCSTSPQKKIETQSSWAKPMVSRILGPLTVGDWGDPPWHQHSRIAPEKSSVVHPHRFLTSSRHRHRQGIFGGFSHNLFKSNVTSGVENGHFLWCHSGNKNVTSPDLHPTKVARAAWPRSTHPTAEPHCSHS